MKIPVLKSLSENKEFFYAVALILLIPAAILTNTFLFIRGMNESFNVELTAKAHLATTILSSTLKEDVNDREKLESVIETVTTNSPEIQGLTILSFEQGIPIVLATNEEEEATSTETVLLTKLAWTTQQPYTTKLEALNENAELFRLWQVSLPIVVDETEASLKSNIKGERSSATSSATKSKSENIEKKTLAVINLKVSGEKSDILISRLERNSIIVAIATLAVVVLLLLNHFRFFGYARLFTKLKEVDEMKDNFISLASHELRTPVTALRGFASLALKHFQSGNQETAVKDMSMVNRSAEGIENLVNDLLDVSRIEQKRLTLEIQNTSLVSAVTEVVGQLQAQAIEKGLALTYTKPATDLFIAVDQQKLKQIFVNIVGNAIKYTLRGSVEISHEIEGDKIKTFIKDTGVGIPAKELSNLFEKFHRVQNEKTRQIRGTGLGLWITKQLIEMMRGEILVESIEDTGTKVIVIFPLARKS